MTSMGGHADAKKPQPNRRRYIAALRAMTPDERLLKAFELSEAAREERLQQLRLENPNSTDDQICTLYIREQFQRSEAERFVQFGQSG